MASCSIQEEDIIVPEQNGVEFYASFEQPAEDGTKVYVNEDYLLRWTADDRISIFNKNTFNQQYMFTGETGDNSGSFRKVDSDEFVTGNAISHVVSVYPYQPTTKISESNVLTVTLPSDQTYAPNSFGLGANTMVSISSDNFLNYKNVSGYLVIKLYGEGVSVSSITLAGNSGEKLAGKATVTMSQDGVPSVAMAKDAVEEIVLTCETPVQLGATNDECTLFWFVVPPTTFENGITITATSAEGIIFQKSTSNSVKVERNRLSSMKALEWTGEYVSTQTSVTIDGLSYILSPDGSAQVARQDKSLSGDIVIPEKVSYLGMSYTVNSIIGPNSTATYGGHTSVSANGGAFQGTAITSVEIPSTITRLPSCAFISCRSLTTVVLPPTLTTISFGCFAYCSSLSEIDIPAGVTNIGEWAFGGCSSLKSFTIPSGVKSLPTAMLYKSGLESIEIPATVTGLSDNCLNMSTLTTAVMYIRDITRVGYSSSCFGNVTNIDLYVPSDAVILYEENHPWRYFKSITGFDDGHTGEAIDPLYRIIEYDGLRYRLSGGVVAVAQQDKSLSGDIVIPESITYDGTEYPITSIISPKSTATYGGHSSISADGGAFQGTAITSVEIPSSITSLPSCAFISCSSLTTVVLPTTLKSISFGCFAYCSSLNEVDIPAGVTYIGEWAFGGCGSLKTVKSYIEDITKVSYSGACFKNVSDTDLYVPAGTMAVYQQYSPWNSFKSIIEF